MPIESHYVNRKHVIQACEQYDNNLIKPKRLPKNTFLIYKNKRYPAKFIRRKAYELAVGFCPDISGGCETKDFLTALGFNVEYNGQLYSGKQVLGDNEEAQKQNIRIDTKVTSDKEEKHNQKEALYRLLKQEFECVLREHKFDWLVVPDYHLIFQSDLGQVLSALYKYRGYSNFITPGWSLAVDFYIPSKQLIIEYDEKQHFTIPREISLLNYRSDLVLDFDKDAW